MKISTPPGDDTKFFTHLKNLKNPRTIPVPLSRLENISTGYSPFELVFGRRIKLTTEIANKIITVYNHTNYAKELRNKLKYYYDLTRENTLKAKEINKTYYDKGRDRTALPLKKHDLVLILNPNKKGEFDTPYEGPFRVIEEQGPKRKGKTVRNT